MPFAVWTPMMRSMRIGMDRLESEMDSRDVTATGDETSFYALDTCKDFFVVSERSEKRPEHRGEGLRWKRRRPQQKSPQ